MAAICDSCFESGSGILPESSFPYSAAYADRLYCVDGHLVAPPSNGAVASLWSQLSVEAVASLAHNQALAIAGTSPSWSNLGGRAATVVFGIDASALYSNSSPGAYVDVAVAFTISDGSTTPTIHMYVPLFLTTSSGSASTQVSANSVGIAVNPGVSVSATVTATFKYPPGGSTASSLAALTMRPWILGAL